MQWLGSVLGLSILVTVFGAGSRHAASHLPPGLSSQASAAYVLVHGMSTGFTGAVAFTALSLLVTLFGIRRRVPADDATATVEAGTSQIASDH